MGSKSMDSKGFDIIVKMGRKLRKGSSFRLGLMASIALLIATSTAAAATTPVQGTSSVNPGSLAITTPSNLLFNGLITGNDLTLANQNSPAQTVNVTEAPGS